MQYSRDTILAMLPEDMTDNSKTHIVSAYRNIFTSIKQFGNIGLGVCTYATEGRKEVFASLTRRPWPMPDPRVVLYSLYKYSEAVVAARSLRYNG